MDNTAENFKKYTIDEYYTEVSGCGGLTELRDGEIINLASPNIEHQDIIFSIATELRNYIKSHSGKCKTMISPTDVKLNEYNIVIPDIFIACNPENFDRQKYNGAPDFIVEVLSGNRADDLYRKLVLYQSAGVREYWIVDPKYKKTLVYFFEETDFPEIYDFDKDIPVQIFKDKEECLKINIADLTT